MGGVREGGRKRVLNLGVEFILILEEALVEYLVEVDKGGGKGGVGGGV